MVNRTVNLKELPEILFELIRTEKVTVNKEDDGGIKLTPVSIYTESSDMGCPLFGLLAEYEDYTLDKFMERRHIDKEFEL